MTKNEKNIQMKKHIRKLDKANKKFEKAIKRFLRVAWRKTIPTIDDPKIKTYPGGLTFIQQVKVGNRGEKEKLWFSIRITEITANTKVKPGVTGK
jgi:hypothetical protein